MAGLLYREDMDDVRQRLTTWWQGGDIGRPALAVTAPRAKPIEEIPALPEPPGWVTDYSTSNFEYRVNLAARACIDRYYLGEAVPYVAPDLGPNCLALYLGATGVEMPGTVWFRPCIEDPAQARFAVDEDNFYWRYTLCLTEAFLCVGREKFLLQFPDLIEGLDTLAGLRSTERLLLDLIERPEWVQSSLRQITELYFYYYEALYARIHDEVGGSVFWMWAPGRLAKLQCDFSAMISPAMFGEFMVPVLREMCARIPYTIYHWDGPGAIPHHDHLLSIPDLKVIQWTAGAGAEPGAHQRWWPLYHKTIEAGKGMYVLAESVDDLIALKREFGQKLKRFYITLSVPSLAEAERALAVVSD